MKRYSAKSRQSFSTRRAAKKSYKNLLISFIIIAIFLYGLLTWILPTLIGGLTFLNSFKNKPNDNSKISEAAVLAPPVLNIPYEATNTAKINIKGYASANTKVEIYVDDSLSKSIDTKDDGSFLVEGVELSLGINNLTSKTVDDKGNKSLPSKNIRVIYDNKKPKLEIKSPNEGDLIKGGDKKTTVTGVTDPGLAVTVNGQKTIVDADGNFSKVIEINEGDNTLTITTSDSAGNSTTTQRKVIYQNQ